MDASGWPDLPDEWTHETVPTSKEREPKRAKLDQIPDNDVIPNPAPRKTTNEGPGQWASLGELLM